MKPKKEQSNQEYLQHIDQMNKVQNELIGRLSQLSETTVTLQNQVNEKFTNQERQLSKTIEERLNNVTKNVHEGLEKSSQKTSHLMGDVLSRLAVIDAAQKNISTLSSQVVSLQDVLSNKQARGAFGETQLKDLVEAIMPPGSFSFQASVGKSNVGSSYRADCLINLPYPPGPVVIDAKFPLEFYHQYRDAKTELETQQALKAFGQSVLKHIQDISSKYIIPGETAESAFMFIPSEAVYSEIYASLPAVVEKSYRSKVFMVSPTTLWATLNTVRTVLKDVKMREQAGVLQKEIVKVLADVVRLNERVQKLQRHFELSFDDLKQIHISTDKITRKIHHIDKLQLNEDEQENVVNLAEGQKKPAQLS